MRELKLLVLPRGVFQMLGTRRCVCLVLACLATSCFVATSASQYRARPTETPCTSDYDCAYGNKCIKERLAFDGVCCEILDRSGVRQVRPPSPESLDAGGDPSVLQAKCRSDYDCVYGQRCLKGQFQYDGVCADTVNQYGVKDYSAPNPGSLGPGGSGQCQFDTQCSVGFRCYKQGYSLYGHCVRR